MNAPSPSDLMDEIAWCPNQRTEGEISTDWRERELACTYGRYGYRMIAGLMRNAGWQLATEDRIRRIWKVEGLKVPEKQQPRGRIWLNDGRCPRLRPEYRNYVWSGDFVLVRNSYGSTSRSRSKRTSAWTNSAYGDESPPTRWLQECGAALATPNCRFELLTIECLQFCRRIVTFLAA